MPENVVRAKSVMAIGLEVYKCYNRYRRMGEIVQCKSLGELNWPLAVSPKGLPNAQV